MFHVRVSVSVSEEGGISRVKIYLEPCRKRLGMREVEEKQCRKRGVCVAVSIVVVNDGGEVCVQE